MVNDIHEKKVQPVSWKVRTEDGSVFGPASVQDLATWARDGRLSPLYVISCDDETWISVTSLPELKMNWVTEVSPGRFYGPIHLDALDELVDSGTLNAHLPRFVRAISPADDPALLQSENALLQEQIASMRRDFAERSSALEEALRVAEASVAGERGKLETRDLEFDAERQAFRARESKLLADIEALRAAESKWKADTAAAAKKAEALDLQLQKALSEGRGHAADKARIDELQKEVDAACRKLESSRKDAAAAAAASRKTARATEKNLLAEREKAEKCRAETKEALERLHEIEIREESIRKLLHQAFALLEDRSAPKGAFSDLIEDGVLLDGAAEGASSDAPHPGQVLGAIEAQAQQEIRTLEGAGPVGRDLFKNARY